MNPTADSSVTNYQAQRRYRYELRDTCARFGGWAVEHMYGGDWAELPWRAAAGCGRSFLSDGSTVPVKMGEADDGSGRAYFAGVRRCGSVWLCSICTATIRAHRADEVGKLADCHVAAGGRLSMATFTVRHEATTDLDALYGAIRGAFTSFQQSKVWRAFRSEMVGTTVTVESTLGDHGFHVHLHVLLLWRGGVRPGLHRRRMAALRRWGGPAWAERVERRLGLRPDDRRGFHVMDMGTSSARYVAKIAGEVTRGDYKSKDALDVMLRGVADGEAQACARYVEWATVMPGKRMIRFSPGLRELYLGDTPELSDEEVVQVDVGSPVVGEVLCDDYLAMMTTTPKRRTPRAVAFLERVERDGCHPLMRPVADPGPGPQVPLSVKVRQRKGLGVFDASTEAVGRTVRAWSRAPDVLELLVVAQE